MSPEFYSRKQFEEIDKKAKDEETFVREFGKNYATLSEEEKKTVRESAENAKIFAKERDFLLQRAWTEALKENEKFEVEKRSGQFRERLEKEYKSAREEFLQFTKDGKQLSQKLIKPINAITELEGISELLLLAAELDSDACRVMFYYPRDLGNGKYEEGCKEIIVEKNGTLRGTENLPPVIQMQGPGKILREVIRCLRKEKYTNNESGGVVTITIEGEFVPEGEGEQRELNGQVSEDPRNLPVELDQMRFEILSDRERKLLFRCIQESGQKGYRWSRGAYEAFVYPCYVIFEPARYGYATYTMIFDEPFDEALIQKIGEESDPEKQQQLCIEALELRGFFEEIHLGKDMRREQGKRYTKNHRWKGESESDEAYFKRLKGYYNDLFDHLENVSAEKKPRS